MCIAGKCLFQDVHVYLKNQAPQQLSCGNITIDALWSITHIHATQHKPKTAALLTKHNIYDDNVNLNLYFMIYILYMSLVTALGRYSLLVRGMSVNRKTQQSSERQRTKGAVKKGRSVLCM